MLDNDNLKKCQWTNESSALDAFAAFAGKTQSANHIKPLHWYVASRLVIEGGFDPREITPQPPFRVEHRSGLAPVLHYDASLGGSGERTILGGLKTKNVDVVVLKEGIGPVVAVSCKGVTGALRNLTNRMEETIGECTNLHITYPALVLGYFILIRANRLIEQAVVDSVQAVEDSPLADQKILTSNDIAISQGGDPVAGIVRFHNALCELVGRQGIRDDISRYESIGLGLVEMHGVERGTLFNDFPTFLSKIHLRHFFNAIYSRYDERFVVSAPDLARRTRRLEWSSDSPAFNSLKFEYDARLAL